MMQSNARGMVFFVGLAVAGMAALTTPAAAQNWEADNQIRVGAFWQSGRTDFTGSNDTLGLSGSQNAGNNGFGMTAGYEMLRNRGLTFGVEGDLGETGAVSANIANARYQGDYFASIRGRVGVFLHKDWDIYATGGLAFRGVSIDDANGVKAERTLYGGIYGGGTEVHFGNTILFAEYLHANYGTETLNPQTTGSGGLVSSTGAYRIGGSSDAIRVGVKLKVGFDNYTDDVRADLRR
jgi:outer membrane protein with beta-barrel domain